MLKRAVLTTLLSAASALVVVAPAAAARPSGPYYWNVAVRGSQDASWKFSVEDSRACPDTAGRTGAGSGGVSLRFASAAGRPFRMAYDPGGPFHTLLDGKVPLTFTNRGRISSQEGTPCSGGANEPEAIPYVADNSGCGSQATTLTASAYIDDRKLSLDGQPTRLKFPSGCPTPWAPVKWGVYPQILWSGMTSCKPDQYALENLVVPATRVPVARLTAKKPFSYSVNEAYHCEFPHAFIADKGLLEVDTVIRYTLTFTPRRGPARGRP